MKTLFNILAALTVIALASADSNAICNGRVGNHANHIGGRDYISCVQRANGEIVAQVQICLQDQKFCPRTGGCLLSEECDIGHKHDSSSDSSSDSSDSSSDSSSEEFLECSHKETKLWVRPDPPSEEKPGCSFCCERNHGSSSSSEESRHHKKCSNEFVGCKFGVCQDFKGQAAGCRVSAADKCPGECCGEGCELTSTPPCPSPNADPMTCKNKCCPAVFTSGLFGSSSRGQIQTESCKACEGDTFFCIYTGDCESTNTELPQCQLELAERCHCDTIKRDPNNCNGYLLVCADIDNKEIPRSCGPSWLFYDDGQGGQYCVTSNPEDEDAAELHRLAQNFCTCGEPGFDVTADGCFGTLCCPSAAFMPFSGVQPRPACYAGKTCSAAKDESFCPSTNQCERADTANTACQDDLFGRCNCNKVRDTNNCFGYLLVCGQYVNNYMVSCPANWLYYEDAGGPGVGGCIAPGSPMYGLADEICKCGSPGCATPERRTTKAMSAV